MSTKLGINIFSVEGGINFLKEIRDTTESMSINYYQLVQSQLTMEYGYGPAGALTEDGMRVYGSFQSPNPRFGLICGDRYINSFKVGASLIFSIRFVFSSR